jgi:hypothetical protein
MSGGIGSEGYCTGRTGAGSSEVALSPATAFTGNHA